LVVAGGCGGRSDNEKANAPASNNGVASKPAKQIVADSAAALKTARSAHLEGTVTIAKKPTAVKIDLEQKNLRFTFKQKGAAVSLIAIGGSVYINANAEFWRQQNAPPAAAALAGHWLKIPASQADVGELTKGLNLATLSRCLVTNHGTLQVAGKTEEGGKPAVVVVDKGDRPGSAPGKLSVSTTGEPLPLRLVVTGKQRAGGPKDPDCNDPENSAQPGDDLRFSRYNEPLSIKPPAGARDLSASSTSSSAS
jgi:hypothetical protein